MTFTAFTALGLACAPTFAASVFSGSAAAVFGTPTPSSGVVYTGVGSSTFTTGVPQGTNAVTNTFSITGSAFNSVPDSTAFAIAGLSYTNGATSTGSTVASVPVNLTVTFAPPASVARTFTFGFAFTFTPNLTGNDLTDADILTPTNTTSSTTFDFGGQTYTLALLGFSDDGGTTIKTTFVLPENQTTKSTLYAEIVPPLTPNASPPAVPVPLAAWAGIALMGSVAARRRRASPIA